MNTIALPSRRVSQAATRTLREIRIARLKLKKKLVAEKMARNDRWYARWFGIGRITLERAEVDAEGEWDYQSFGYSLTRFCKQLLELCQAAPIITLSVEDAHRIGVQDVIHR